MNPFMDIVSFREGLIDSFGTDSPLYRNTTEGIVYALTRAIYDSGRPLPPDLFEVEKLISNRIEGTSEEEGYQFVHGYVIGLSYLHAVWDDLEKGQEVERAQRATRLLFMFQSPTGRLY